ncbi:velvet factor-domain-containing protein [Gigaspora rosea]|uniref:Velvet factor-domain-containing protein n=1 Tax=Gigaspora rosea TaxID=44941 RepID=A0A397W1V8_9GLOM|nr:velvet factor-domain-containing protein [Gigaspora rosea]
MTVSGRHIHFMIGSPPGPITYKYQLEVSQEPIRARMCGFGDKDRRTIDPPPIIKLIVTTTDGTPVPESSIDYSMMIVHAGLWSKDCKEERGLVVNPTSIFTKSANSNSTVMSVNAPLNTRNLMGHCTSSAYVLNNHVGQKGVYFIFQDLSVRTEGTFTLKFSSPDELTNARGNVAAEVYSAPFRVYSAKKFPGMTESTELSKAFAKQGIKIPIRKEAYYKKVCNNNIQPTVEVPKSETLEISSSDSEDIEYSDENEETRDYSNLQGYESKDMFAAKRLHTSK